MAVVLVHCWKAIVGTLSRAKYPFLEVQKKMCQKYLSVKNGKI